MEKVDTGFDGHWFSLFTAGIDVVER